MRISDKARGPRPFISGLQAFSFLVLAILMSASTAAASVHDVYISQNDTGNGTSCSDTLPASWFNNSANWGNASTQIGSGTTVHLCGTFTGSAGSTELTFYGSGSSGSPIILHFEAGAILQATYWGTTGAISTNGHTYLMIDGGANGLIQNTLNGTSGAKCPGGPCSNQQNSVGVYMTGCSTCNIEVRDLTIADIYVHSGTSDNCCAATYGIAFVGNLSNVTVDHDTIHDARIGIDGWGPNVSVFNNEVYNCADGEWFGTNAPTSNLIIHDNSFHGVDNWSTSNDSFHLEDIYIFPDTSPANASSVVIYNNWFASGGLNNTAHLYMTGAFTSPQVFNNLFDNTGNYHMPGLWIANEGTFSFTNPLIVNNTFLGGDETFGGNIDFQAYGITGITFQNNLVTGGNVLVLIAADRGSSSTITVLNNNAYENIVNDGGASHAFYLGSTGYTTLAAWQTATSGESNSIFDTISTLKLNTNGMLQPGSPAIQLGANLTGLGISALDSDKPATVGVGGSDTSNPRPPSGAWDSGAYAYVTGPAPPTDLNAIVH